MRSVIHGKVRDGEMVTSCIASEDVEGTFEDKDLLEPGTFTSRSIDASDMRGMYAQPCHDGQCGGSFHSWQGESNYAATSFSTQCSDAKEMYAQSFHDGYGESFHSWQDDASLRLDKNE